MYACVSRSINVLRARVGLSPSETMKTSYLLLLVLVAGTFKNLSSVLQRLYNVLFQSVTTNRSLCAWIHLYRQRRRMWYVIFNLSTYLNPDCVSTYVPFTCLCTISLFIYTHFNNMILYYSLAKPTKGEEGTHRMY